MGEKDGIKIYHRGNGPVSHTIFGRLVKGVETIHLIQGTAEFKKRQSEIEKRVAKGLYGEDLFTKEAKEEELKKLTQSILKKSKDHTAILIKDCGVYKFTKNSQERKRASAVGEAGFDPKDFYDRRSNK